MTEPTPSVPAVSPVSPGDTHLLRVLARDGALVDPASDPGIPDDDVVRLYAAMLALRVTEERMLTLQRQGRIGFYLSSLGEEACSFGVAYGLEPTDWVFPSYREPGVAFWRGMDFQSWVDNMFGNAGDPVLGRQMPVHWSAREQSIVSISSPVGTQIPQAVGVAYASKFLGHRTVALAFFGDGTSSEGDFHVGANFAGVWKVPAILFIRNNRFAISTPYHVTTAVEHLVSRAHGYGITGVRVDGNDLFAVTRAVREAADRGRSGGGATLIEACTYRVGAHSSSDDPKVYRKEDEVQPWREADPLARVRRYLEARGLWGDALERSTSDAASVRIIEAVKIAEKKSHPPLETAFSDVFAHPTPRLAAQRDACLAHVASGQSAFGRTHP